MKDIGKIMCHCIQILTLVFGIFSSQFSYATTMLELVQKKVFDLDQSNLSEQEKAIIVHAAEGKQEDLLKLGRLYRSGEKGVPYNPDRSTSIFRFLAHQNHFMGMHFYTNALYDGFGVKINLKKSKSWALKTIQKGLTLIDAKEGQAAALKKTIAETHISNQKEELVRKMNSLEAKIADISVRIGLCYETFARAIMATQEIPFMENMIQEYFKKAVKFYTKAAELGSAHANYLIGVAYEFALGVQEDFKAAFSYYLKSSEKEFPKAFFALGTLLENGKGVKKHPEKALARYRQAARFGNIAAIIHIAEDHIMRDEYDDALEWLEKGIKLGDADCMLRAGLIYKSRTSLENKRKAYALLSKASKKGSMVSEFQFAVLCNERLGDEEHPLSEEDLEVYSHNAFYTFKEFAKDGDSEGMLYLARCYFNGISVDQNFHLALHWYEKAHQSGNKSAKFEMVRILQEKAQYCSDAPFEPNLWSRAQAVLESVPQDSSDIAEVEYELALHFSSQGDMVVQPFEASQDVRELYQKATSNLISSAKKGCEEAKEYIKLCFNDESFLRMIFPRFIVMYMLLNPSDMEFFGIDLTKENNLLMRLYFHLMLLEDFLMHHISRSTRNEYEHIPHPRNWSEHKEAGAKIDNIAAHLSYDAVKEYIVETLGDQSFGSNRINQETVLKIIQDYSLMIQASPSISKIVYLLWQRPEVRSSIANHCDIIYKEMTARDRTSAASFLHVYHSYDSIRKQPYHPEENNGPGTYVRHRNHEPMLNGLILAFVKGSIIPTGN